MKKFFLLILVMFGGILTYNEIVSNPSIEPTNFNHISNGYLKLINSSNKLQDNEIELKKIPNNLSSNVLIEETFYLEEKALESLRLLFLEANKDGIQHFIINSAYRDTETQKLLFEQHGKDYALPPGYSEHESGLAIDIGSTQGQMQGSDEASWLSMNAHKYGFILRYPAHKTEVTGIAFEPWHFRYVGLPHSTIMYENDLVLEEYIEKLEQGHSFAFQENSEIYSVFYTEHLQQIEMDHIISISGTNRTGYIVTAISI